MLRSLRSLLGQLLSPDYRAWREELDRLIALDFPGKRATDLAAAPLRAMWRGGTRAEIVAHQITVMARAERKRPRRLCRLGLHDYRTIATYPDAPADMLDECSRCGHRVRHTFTGA